MDVKSNSGENEHTSRRKISTSNNVNYIFYAEFDYGTQIRKCSDMLCSSLENIKIKKELQGN